MKIKQFFLILLTATLSFAQKAPSYYDGINFKSKGYTLKKELADLITKTHTKELTYREVWDVLKKSDLNPDNENEVLLLYGSESFGKHARSRDLNATDRGRNVPNTWNREHTYARSLARPKLTTDEPGAGTDAHHLRPADKDLNKERSNKRFDDGKGTRSYTTNRGGWFPGDEWKGDVARMMMYMYLRYGKQCPADNIGLPPNIYSSDFPDVFIKWNIEDPVSDFEKRRNNVIALEQGNRNPFIDNPYLATLIWGGPKAENTWTESIDTNYIIEEEENKQLNEYIVYPNPVRENQEKKIMVQGEDIENLKWLKIYNIQGELLKHIINPFISGHAKTVDLSGYGKGIFIIQTAMFSKKVLVL
ncbi:endonuclease [Weeksellaceae bacterium TAE3-ERU29]|nr:endonuclease [Weeksellaceae bacterium TAE3-ERU29]